MPGVVVVTGTSTSGPGRVAQPDKVTASTTVIAKCAYRRPPGSRLCGMAMTRSAFQADDGLRPDRDASGANFHKGEDRATPARPHQGHACDQQRLHDAPPEQRAAP